MKSILIIFLLILANIAKSQDTLNVATDQRKLEFQVNRLTEELSLTPEQADQVSVILQQRFVDIKSNPRGKNVGEGINSRNYNQTVVKQLGDILTEEQMKLFTISRQRKQSQIEAYERRTNNKRQVDEILDF